jgi:protein TonB
VNAARFSLFGATLIGGLAFLKFNLVEVDTVVIQVSPDPGLVSANSVEELVRDMPPSSPPLSEPPVAPEIRLEPDGSSVVAGDEPPIGAEVIWKRTAGARDIDNLYPDRALRRKVEGSVTLSCLVGARGRIQCIVKDERPEGYGFGQAALRASRSYVADVRLSDGALSFGYSLELTVDFRIDCQSASMGSLIHRSACRP